MHRYSCLLTAIAATLQFADCNILLTCLLQVLLLAGPAGMQLVQVTTSISNLKLGNALNKMLHRDCLDVTNSQRVDGMSKQLRQKQCTEIFLEFDARTFGHVAYPGMRQRSDWWKQSRASSSAAAAPSAAPSQSTEGETSLQQLNWDLVLSTCNLSAFLLAAQRQFCSCQDCTPQGTLQGALKLATSANSFLTSATTFLLALYSPVWRCCWLHNRLEIAGLHVYCSACRMQSSAT